MDLVAKLNRLNNSDSAKEKEKEPLVQARPPQQNLNHSVNGA